MQLDDIEDAEGNKYLGMSAVAREIGFGIYHLIKYFKDSEDPEHRQMIKEELAKYETTEAPRDFLAHRIFGDITNLGISLFKASIGKVF